MSIFTDLFGPREKQTSPGETIFLIGMGTFDTPLAGGERSQAALESIYGRHERRGVSLVETARLVVGDRDPKGRPIVRVMLRGRQVGFLPLRVAALYRQELHARGKPRADGECQAAIRGGWFSSDGRKGDFEVWLDLPPWSQ